MHFTGHHGEIVALEVDYRSDTLFSGSTDQTVFAWDLETFTRRSMIFCPSGKIRCLRLCIPSNEKPTEPEMVESRTDLATASRKFVSLANSQYMPMPRDELFVVSAFIWYSVCG